MMRTAPAPSPQPARAPSRAVAARALGLLVFLGALAVLAVIQARGARACPADGALPLAALRQAPLLVAKRGALPSPVERADLSGDGTDEPGILPPRAPAAPSYLRLDGDGAEGASFSAGAPIGAAGSPHAAPFDPSAESAGGPQKRASAGRARAPHGAADRVANPVRGPPRRLSPLA